MSQLAYMSCPRSTLRRLLWIGGALMLAGGAALIVWRRAATHTALSAALRAAGASDVRLAVKEASPWRVEMEGVGFGLQEHQVSARKVTVERARWWQPRLSSLRVEGAAMALDLTSPEAAKPASEAGAARVLPAMDVPVDRVSVDGVLSVKFEAEDTEEFAVKFEAVQATRSRWNAEVEATAPGSRLHGLLELDFATSAVSWRDVHAELDLSRAQDWARRLEVDLGPLPALGGRLVMSGAGAALGDDFNHRGRIEWRDGTAGERPAALSSDLALTPGVVLLTAAHGEAELAPWMEFIRSLDLLPAEVSELQGRVQFDGELALREGALGGRGAVEWSDGGVTLTDPDFTATGIAASFRFDDLAGLRSQPGTVRIAQLRLGAVTAAQADLELSVQGLDELSVHRATFESLGGRMSTGPFIVRPLRQEFEATFVLDGVAMEQVLALTDKVPATAVGRVDGRVPVRWTKGEFYFGTGWLALKAGTTAELELHARGLLTGGVPPTDVRGELMQKVESGLLRLVVSELRLDLRPPNAPDDRTAVLRITGQPKSSELKTTLNLEVNVNGPVEQLLNLGMDERLSFGGVK